MKKILITILFLFFTSFNFLNINAFEASYLIVTRGDGFTTKFDKDGLQLFSVSNHNGNEVQPITIDSNQNFFTFNTFRSPLALIKQDSNGNVISSINTADRLTTLATDSNDNIVALFLNGQVIKYDNDLNILWSVNDLNQAFTFDSIKIDSNDNIYVTDNNFSGQVAKYDSNGNLLWLISLSRPRDIVIDSNDEVYLVNRENLYKVNPLNGSFIYTIPNILGSTSAFRKTILLEHNGILFIGTEGGHIGMVNASNGSVINTVRPFSEYILSGNIDALGNIYLGYLNNSNVSIAKFNNNLNLIWNNNSISANINKIALPIAGDSVEYPLEVNLSSNYNPFADITYESNFLTTTSSIVNDLIISPSSITVSSIKTNISPFTFLHWWDIDNQVVFSTDREFVIEEPTRDYNLEAIYSLDNSINLSLNSNLPSPPNFNLFVDTIEEQTAIISQYPFINEEIPYGYNFNVTAPTDNIGVYIFDYWYDNDNNQPFTNDTTISLSAIQNYNLTAVYSLPEEYQINLILQVPVGFIIFQHGDLDPVSGPFISATIGLGDKWNATAPLNENYRFTNWLDMDSFNLFSLNREISINSTNKNYFLRASYIELVTIYWDSLGGNIINPSKVDIATSYFPPSINPVRPNFVFGGWAYPDTPNTPVNFPQFATENATFQAIWIPTYTLTFNSNGGSSIPIQTIIENNTPTAVTPSRFGYTFEGWFTDNITFNNPFDFNQPFTQNTIVHAKWEFGTERDAEVSLNGFFTDAGLDNPIAQWIIVLALFIFLNVMIFIYKGPFIVTIILNFILTALFIVLGFIPIWITIIIFMALFGFGILMFTGGRS